MTQPNLLSLAKQGDTRALTSLLNRSLQPRGITAKATKRDEQLHILLEAPEIPSKLASVRCIQQGLEKLELVDMPVNIYGRQQGQTQIAWQEYLAAPIRSISPEDGFFDAELLEDGDAPEPTGGDPTQASEDWSDQATAIEVADHPLPPAPPPPSISPQSSGQSSPQSSGQPSTNWDNFELDAVAAKPVPSKRFEPPASAAWSAGMPVDYSPEEADPTLIVPDEGEDDMDAALNDEDADSEILLSLWDDANLDDDIEPSGDVSDNNLSLWQEGEAAGSLGKDPTVLSDEPISVGDSARARSRKQFSCLPLLLLGLLALLGGVAVAAYLNVPWLANVPGVGPLLSQKASQDAPGKAGSSSEGTADSEEASVPTKAVESTAEQTSPTEGTPKTGSEAIPEVSPEAAPKTTPETASNQPIVTSPETTASSTDPFREAVNAATQAANLAQTADSPEAWGQVVDSWSRAIENMQAVSSDHPRYEMAQQKIPEYQRYLDYAQQQL